MKNFVKAYTIWHSCTMNAELIFRDRYIYNDGAIREMVIWRLPITDPEHPHGCKYRLFYGYPQKCLVRYDNERGKGDHRHYMGLESPYGWHSVRQLVLDFQKDIDELRGVS